MSFSTAEAIDRILQWNKEGDRGRFHLDLISLQSWQVFNTPSRVKLFLLPQDPGDTGFSPMQPA